MGILGLMEINDETSNTNKYNMVKKSQLAGGKPIVYSQE